MGLVEAYGTGESAFHEFCQPARVCGIAPSVKAAYQAKAKGIGVSIQSVYDPYRDTPKQYGTQSLNGVAKSVRQARTSTSSVSTQKWSMPTDSGRCRDSEPPS